MMNFNFEEKKQIAVDFCRKYWMPIVGFFIVIAVIVSVVNIYREEILHIDDSITYVKQDTINIPSNSIDTLNPITTITEDSYYINKLLYSSLFAFDENLGVQEDLVKKYEVNTEKAYIDITLKSGIKFHDGTKLTASDVSFTIDAIKSYGSNGLYYEKANKILSVNVTEDDEIRIYFKNNYDCALDYLTFPIVPKEQYKNVNAFLNAKNFTPVGTGQYKISEYDSYKTLELTPNKSYYGEKATKNISVQIVPDKGNLDNLIENGTITCYLDKSAERKSVATNNDLPMYDIVSNEVDFIYFNTSKGVFKKKSMRKAVAYAINNQEILEKVYLNDGVLTDTIYYPNFLGVEDTGKSYLYNPEKAAELLSKAGYKDEDSNGVLEDKKEKELEIKILVNSENAHRIAAAKHISKDLKSLGFNVVINTLPMEEYQHAIKINDFDILFTGYAIEESYDLRMFFDGKSPWGYMNLDLYTQVRNFDRLYTIEEYTSHYEKLKEMLNSELPYYPLVYKNMGLIGTGTFEAEKMPMHNNIYQNISTWSWTKIEKTETE